MLSNTVSNCLTSEGKSSWIFRQLLVCEHTSKRGISNKHYRSGSIARSQSTALCRHKHSRPTENTSITRRNSSRTNRSRLVYSCVSMQKKTRKLVCHKRQLFTGGLIAHSYPAQLPPTGWPCFIEISMFCFRGNMIRKRGPLREFYVAF